MTKLEQLIQEKCPNGVEYKKLKDVSLMRRGTSLTKSQSTFGNIPVISGGKEPAFYCNISNRNADIVTVAGSGAGAGYVQYFNYPIFANDCFTIEGTEETLTKYLYYFLSNVQNKIYETKKGGGVPHVHISDIENYEIPVPPLEVQREIVEILDKFTLLTAELTAELTARREQFKTYREKELNSMINMKTIGELSSFRRGSFPQPYGNREWYDGDGCMPFVQVADIGEDMKLVKETKRKISLKAQPMSVFAPAGSIIISLQGSIGRIAMTQYDAFIDRTVAIFNDLSKDILPKYFVYQLQKIFAIKEKSARGSTIKTITKEEFTSFKIPVPSLKEQKKVVDILDRFNMLCNDISSGLPAEIEARQKQYEYYRDKLLTFKRLEA